MNVEMLALLNQKFKGKKTYAAAIAAIAAAVVSYLAGDSTVLEALQLAFTGLLAGTLRSGIADTVAK